MKNSELTETIKEEIKVYKDEDTINEVFEWWQPLLALGGSVGLMATALFAVIGPSMVVGGAFMGGDSWGDVFRHYKKKFQDKRAAKNLTKEDVLELINLIQTNIDTSDLKSGVKRYMKSLMNELGNEMNKDEEELDKNKLLRLFRDVQNYSERIKIKGKSVTEVKIKNQIKEEIIRILSEEEMTDDEMEKKAEKEAKSKEANEKNDIIEKIAKYQKSIRKVKDIMKDRAKDYKKAEGKEKDNIKTDLKTLTLVKKKIEAKIKKLDKQL